jgi:hypothetical protein
MTTIIGRAVTPNKTKPSTTGWKDVIPAYHPYSDTKYSNAYAGAETQNRQRSKTPKAHLQLNPQFNKKTYEVTPFIDSSSHDDSYADPRSLDPETTIVKYVKSRSPKLKSRGPRLNSRSKSKKLGGGSPARKQTLKKSYSKRGHTITVDEEVAMLAYEQEQLLLADLKRIDEEKRQRELEERIRVEAELRELEIEQAMLDRDMKIVEREKGFAKNKQSYLAKEMAIVREKTEKIDEKLQDVHRRQQLQRMEEVAFKEEVKVQNEWLANEEQEIVARKKNYEDAYNAIQRRDFGNQTETLKFQSQYTQTDPLPKRPKKLDKATSARIMQMLELMQLPAYEHIPKSVVEAWKKMQDVGIQMSNHSDRYMSKGVSPIHSYRYPEKSNRLPSDHFDHPQGTSTKTLNHFGMRMGGGKRRRDTADILAVGNKVTRGTSTGYEDPFVRDQWWMNADNNYSADGEEENGSSDENNGYDHQRGRYEDPYSRQFKRDPFVLDRNGVTHELKGRVDEVQFAKYLEARDMWLKGDIKDQAFYRLLADSVNKKFQLEKHYEDFYEIPKHFVSESSTSELDNVTVKEVKKKSKSKKKRTKSQKTGKNKKQIEEEATDYPSEDRFATVAKSTTPKPRRKKKSQSPSSQKQTIKQYFNKHLNSESPNEENKTIRRKTKPRLSNLPPIESTSDVSAADPEERKRLYDHMNSNIDHLNHLRMHKLDYRTTFERNPVHNEMAGLLKSEGLREDFWARENDVADNGHINIAHRLAQAAQNASPLAKTVVAKDAAFKLDQFVRVNYKPTVIN